MANLAPIAGLRMSAGTGVPSLQMLCVLSGMRRKEGMALEGPVAEALSRESVALGVWSAWERASAPLIRKLSHTGTWTSIPRSAIVKSLSICAGRIVDGEEEDTPMPVTSPMTAAERAFVHNVLPVAIDPLIGHETDRRTDGMRITFPRGTVWKLPDEDVMKTMKKANEAADRREWMDECDYCGGMFDVDQMLLLRNGEVICQEQCYDSSIDVWYNAYKIENYGDVFVPNWRSRW